MQRFEDMYIRVLEERFYTYKMPEDKSLTMYDFYVLDYLNYLLDQPSKNFRDLPSDLEDSVRSAVQNLYPALREELLNAVFYAICAEIRHAEVNKLNRTLLNEHPKYVELYKHWLKYKNFHGKSLIDKEELMNLYDVKKPSSVKRTPQSEKSNDAGRNISYKAANYAIEQTGLSTADFVKMCEYLYDYGTWATSYGGKAWANICKGWLMLNEADQINTSVKDDKTKQKSTKKPMGVAIDHIYDLQHNTDTVFNKLTSYYKGGYFWILKALDDKANTDSYHKLLSKSSGTVKAMALPILYNKLGTTWEKEIKLEKPAPATILGLPPIDLDFGNKLTDTNTPDTNTPDTYTPDVGDVLEYESIITKTTIKIIISNIEQDPNVKYDSIIISYDVYEGSNTKSENTTGKYNIFKNWVNTKLKAGTIKVTKGKGKYNIEVGDVYIGHYTGTEYLFTDIKGNRATVKNTNTGHEFSNNVHAWVNDIKMGAYFKKESKPSLYDGIRQKISVLDSKPPKNFNSNINHYSNIKIGDKLKGNYSGNTFTVIDSHPTKITIKDEKGVTQNFDPTKTTGDLFTKLTNSEPRLSNIKIGDKLMYGSEDNASYEVIEYDKLKDTITLKHSNSGDTYIENLKEVMTRYKNGEITKVEESTPNQI
jgi:hypothetical protein